VTAREFIDIFFQPEIKKEWDDTIERCNIVEQISPHTVILHQVHRRIFPAAVRESLFWSQRLNVTSEKSPDAYDAWMVSVKKIKKYSFITRFAINQSNVQMYHCLLPLQSVSN
jgi:collagen type IV alpha-3-binding protein